jgi:hypothetical protein
MNALRHIMSQGEYEALRRKEREERERQAQQEEDRAFIERREAWLQEHEAEQEVRRYVDNIARTHTAEPVSASIPSEGPQTPQEAPAEKTQREMVRDAKKLRSKLSRAVKSKVQADAKDRVNAKAHADKVVARLEKAGRL